MEAVGIEGVRAGEQDETSERLSKMNSEGSLELLHPSTAFAMMSHKLLTVTASQHSVRHKSSPLLDVQVRGGTSDISTAVSIAMSGK